METDAVDTGVRELPPLTLAVQAGGESRRMGRSKATVPFLGRPLLERVVARLAPLAAEVLVTTNEPENLGFLSGLPCAPKVRLVRDVLERRSSLGGLVTTFTEARCELVAVCACDMMFASADLFAYEARLLAGDACLAAAVPVLPEGFEPFHAVYRRDACLAAARASLEAGQRSVRRALASVPVREVTPAEVERLSPQLRCFTNANTPEELAACEQLACAGE